MSTVVLWPGDRRARAIVIVCLAIAALYLGKGIYRGLTFSHGDFYTTMPGGYASRWNPTLWNSSDLVEARGYNKGAYYYGPTQYLTLFPIVFLNSYAHIASLLLGVYPLVLIAACVVLWKMLERQVGQAGLVGQAGPVGRIGKIGDVGLPVLLALAMAFLPLTQSLVQREFEVVAFLVLVAACAWLARGHEVAAGAAVAYLTWFKYWPIVLLGTFVMHRRLKGLAAFVAASAVLLLTAQVAFGLDGFLIGRTAGIVGGLLRPLGGGDVLYPVIERGAQKSDFCRQWIGGRGTQVDVRWALCGVEDRFAWISAKAVFYALAAVTAALFVWGAVKLERRPADTETAKWGAIWEMSILTMAGAAFVHAHYYYLIVLLLPLAALAYRYATRPQAGRSLKVALWLASYVLLNALVVPTSWLSAILQRDAWAAYVDSGACLLGILLLLGLVLLEFIQLTRRAPVMPAAV